MNTIKLLNVHTRKKDIKLVTDILGERYRQEERKFFGWKWTVQRRENVMLQLVWEHHPRTTGLRAMVNFPNKWALSIVKGELFYCNSEPVNSDTSTFEVGIMYDGELIYDTPLEGYYTGDVLGHLTKNDIMNVALQVAQYK